MSRSAFLGWSIAAYALFLACIVLSAIMVGGLVEDPTELNSERSTSGASVAFAGVAYLGIMGWACFHRHGQTDAANWLFVAFLVALSLAVAKDIYTTSTGHVLTNALRAPFWAFWVLFLIWPKEGEAWLWRKAA